MGLASLGMRLARPQSDLQPQHLHLSQSNDHHRNNFNHNNFNRGSNFNRGNFNHGNAFRETGLAAEVRRFTGLRLLTFNQEHAPARSAGLITAEASKAFPPAGAQASEACLAVVVPMVAAVDDITDPVCLRES